MTRLRSAIAIGLPILFLAVATFPVLARQDSALPPIEVGAGPIGEPSVLYAGRVRSTADRLQLIGYVTGGTNLAPLLSIGEGDPGPGAARFTFTAEIADLDRANRADVRTLSGTGEFRIYLDDGGADWSDLATFADGELVATYSISLSETLQRQDPSIGVVVGDGVLTQDSAGEFSLADTAYRFGAQGIAARLRYTGALIAGPSSQDEDLASVIGAIFVTDRPARPIPLGSSSDSSS